METRAQGGADAHECEQCGETFPTEQELEQHVEQQHPSQDQDPPLTSAAGPISEVAAARSPRPA